MNQSRTLSSVLFCLKCNEDFDKEKHKPIILSCNHTVCATCYNELKKAKDIQLCPFDGEPIIFFPFEIQKVNHYIMQLMDLRKKQMAQPLFVLKDLSSTGKGVFGQSFSTNTSKLKCPNGNQLKWKDKASSSQKEYCFGHCNDDEGLGWKCDECSYFYCFKCDKDNNDAYDYSMCRMGHKMKYLQDANAICIGHLDKTPNGFQCTDSCDYFLCESCSHFSYTPNKCYEGLKTKWNGKVMKKCSKHGEVFRSGYICSTCDYYYCDQCAQSDLKKYGVKDKETAKPQTETETETQIETAQFLFPSLSGSANKGTSLGFNDTKEVAKDDKKETKENNNKNDTNENDKPQWGIKPLNQAPTSEPLFMNLGNNPNEMFKNLQFALSKGKEKAIAIAKESSEDDDNNDDDEKPDEDEEEDQSGSDSDSEKKKVKKQRKIVRIIRKHK